MAATDALPVPQKNVAYRVTFPILDADGDLVTAAGALDSELSQNNGTFADATNEATEVATSSGMYYLDLTAAEMNNDSVAIIVKSTGGKTTPIVLYPEEAGDIRVNVTQVNGTTQTAGDLMGSIGEENAAAAAGDPSTTESLMQYIKQLVNLIAGAAGIGTNPAEQAPANGVNIFEILNAIYNDTITLNGVAARTNNSNMDALLGVADTAGRTVPNMILPVNNSAFGNLMFEMYNSTTNQPATGLTVTGERSINAGAYVAVAGAIAEISDGTYQFDALAADMNGINITFKFSAAGAHDTFVHVRVAD